MCYSNCTCTNKNRQVLWVSGISPSLWRKSAMRKRGNSGATVGLLDYFIIDLCIQSDNHQIGFFIDMQKWDSHREVVHYMPTILTLP